MNFAPFEAADDALLSAVPAAPGEGDKQHLHQGVAQLHTAPDKVSSRPGAPSARPTIADENEEDIDVSCAVCLEEYNEPVVVVTAQCTHSFCKRCITCWLSINHSSAHAQGPSCPLCKRPVTWLLSLSASSSPTPPFRFVLLAVGPDAELLERQPWPSPSLLQVARQKQLDLYEARERRCEQRKQQQQQDKIKAETSSQGLSDDEARGSEKGKKREYQPGAGVRQGRSLTESLHDELRCVNAEIALLKSKKRP